MKVSVKLQDHHQDCHKSHRQPPLLLRAKIPITVFGFPFLSHFSTTTAHPSDLALSLSTSFSSGPSLKLSYATTASASASENPPFILTLKSGTGLFGSPNNSPLVISAHFSFNPSNPNHLNPTFSLFVKPQLGSFSLRKSTFSHSKSDISGTPTNGEVGNDTNSFGFVPLERPLGAKDLSVMKNDDKESIFKGIQLVARTQMPMASRVALNCRWGVSFPDDFGVKMPVLRINKIGIERVDEVIRQADERNQKSDQGNTGEVEMLKGMCFWMKRELDALTGINREMKSELAEMKARHMMNSGEPVRKKASSSSGGFEEWRSKKNGGPSGDNVIKEEKKNGSLSVDVESELQRAIKAAASSP